MADRQPAVVDVRGESYERVLDLQRTLLSRRLAEEIPDTLVVAEHPPTLTLGKSSRPRDLLIDRSVLRELGIAVVPVGRGGEITYHGPGQLVVYPIVHLYHRSRALRRYVWGLEETIIRALKDRFAISAGRDAVHRGVWCPDPEAWVAGPTGRGAAGETGAAPSGQAPDATGIEPAPAERGATAARPAAETGTGGRSRYPGPRKIAAIGVEVHQGVTMHGLALNVTTDLTPFGYIVPCGIRDRGVTSILHEVAMRREVAALCGRNGSAAPAEARPPIVPGEPPPESAVTVVDAKDAVLKAFAAVFSSLSS